MNEEGNQKSGSAEEIRGGECRGGDERRSGGGKTRSGRGRGRGRGETDRRIGDRDDGHRRGSRQHDNSGGGGQGRGRGRGRSGGRDSSSIPAAGATSGTPRTRKNKARTKRVRYEPHLRRTNCLARYAAEDPAVVRGKIRVMPSRNGAAFVTCDRGSLTKDVLIKDENARNRALDGDIVFVELLPLVGTSEEGGTAVYSEGGRGSTKREVRLEEFMHDLDLNEDDAGHGNCDDKREQRRLTEEGKGVDDGGSMEEMDDVKFEEEEYVIVDGVTTHAIEEDGNGDVEAEVEMWHDDEVQMRLWDPVLNLRRKARGGSSEDNGSGESEPLSFQRSGKVIFVVHPKTNAKLASDLISGDDGDHKADKISSRTVVGTLTKLPDGDRSGGGRLLLVPNNRSLPRFMCPPGTREASTPSTAPNDSGRSENRNKNVNEINGPDASKTLYRAEYNYGTWHDSNRWPPCVNVTIMCGSCNVEGETKALLVEHGVDHGDFSPAVFRDVEKAVKSGRCLSMNAETKVFAEATADPEMEWKPTEDMLRGRRDYRQRRIFTIDPTSAKDLDDALHVEALPDGRVEIGVHIADVSHFLKPDTAVDEEALRRATTVYLVDRVVPMLPKPLCEISCSLNEDVERLAFSVVWTMNMDGTLEGRRRKEKNEQRCRGGDDGVWYGRTVIKSCARLDYVTAQNIIDRKGTDWKSRTDEALWPLSRRPTGGHTMNEVAADVCLLHKVAMSRRLMRFANGALALNGIKLAFQLEDDGVSPRLCAPYPIYDSNRLIEEFMLLANYLVAQRLLTHAGGRALLRNHAPPPEHGMQTAVDVCRESSDFEIDTTSSQTLSESLSRLTRECDDNLIIQCVTEALMIPMKPAMYIAAGELDEEDWKHFALNVPYYTHFTSPIRRYPDVLVHRLLQATLDDDAKDFPLSVTEIHCAAYHCNDMRMNAKKAQDRSSRVFLSLFLNNNPITSTLGVCLGVGEKTFTVFVPSFGFSTRVFLQEHEDTFDVNAFEDSNEKRCIILRPKTDSVLGMNAEDGGDCDPPAGARSWKTLEIKVFTKLEISCHCKKRTPIDVGVMVVGPWTGTS